MAEAMSNAYTEEDLRLAQEFARRELREIIRRGLHEKCGKCESAARSEREACERELLQRVSPATTPCSCPEFCTYHARSRFEELRARYWKAVEALDEARAVIAYDLKPCPKPECDHCERATASLPIIDYVLAKARETGGLNG